MNNLVTSIWDEDESDAYNEKYLEFNTDPLALALSRVQDRNVLDGIDFLLNVPEAAQVKSIALEYTSRANKIKKYYRNKLTMAILKDGHVRMSPFRLDLHNYLTQDNQNKIRRKDIPMLIKLVDFYEEDTTMDELVKTVKTDSSAYVDKLTSKGTLYPLKRTQRKTQKVKENRYWFRDGSDQLYLIALDTRNPCVKLFEREFAQEHLTVAGHRTPSKERGQQYAYYRLYDWEIL